MATIEIPKAIQKALSDALKAAHQAGREEARAEMAASLTREKVKRGRKAADPGKPRKPRADKGQPRGPRKPKAEAQPKAHRKLKTTLLFGNAATAAVPPVGDND